MSASAESGDYLQDQSYEAWKNFILILAALLVGDCFASFGQIKQAFLSLTDFDKSYPQEYWPFILASMVVLYIVKNAHGVLITLFDVEYAKQIAKTRSQVVLFYVYTASVIVSFSLVLRLVQLVEGTDSLRRRSIGLMLFTFMPSLLLLLFDFLHQGFVFGSSNRKIYWLRTIRSSPMDRTTHVEFKIIWIMEDLLSIAIFLAWFVSISWVLSSPTTKITVTLVALVSILLMNSIVDYVLNCNYFFFERRLSEPNLTIDPNKIAPPVALPNLNEIPASPTRIEPVSSS